MGKRLLPWVNPVLAGFVFILAAKRYGIAQGFVLASLLLVILLGYDRLRRRHGEALRRPPP